MSRNNPNERLERWFDRLVKYGFSSIAVSIAPIAVGLAIIASARIFIEPFREVVGWVGVTLIVVGAVLVIYHSWNEAHKSSKRRRNNSPNNNARKK